MNWICIKYCFCFLVTIFLPKILFANAAQPGVWNAGGTVYTMLYPEDSATYKKVQMVEEKIYIQLYKGFAVVKGEYVFKNTTAEVLQFKMGYPVNGIYSGGNVDLNQVKIDSLSQFKVYARGSSLPIFIEQNDEYGNIINFSDNWRVWQMDFLPNETQEVKVYFIVNTNNGIVTKGYTRQTQNAFIYLLESGSVWKNPIQKAGFYVQLMEGLLAKDLNGLSEGFGFGYNQTNQLLRGSKLNFSPSPLDNLVVTYYKNEEDFSFEEKIQDFRRLYDEIDSFSKQNLLDLEYNPISIDNPYLVKNNMNFYFLIFTIGFAMVIFLFFIFLKKRSKRKLMKK